VSDDVDGVNAAPADESAQALPARLADARARLADAAATADLPGVAAALDDLEEAHGVARGAGITIPRADFDGIGRGEA